MRISYKTLLLPSLLILGGVYTALTSSSNPPLGHTGSPGESNCTSCHGGTALNSGPATRSLLLNGSVPTAYVPGQTYNVSLTVNRATRVKFGFQLKVEDGNGSDAGTLISTTNRTDLASGYLGSNLERKHRHHVRHHHLEFSMDRSGCRNRRCDFLLLLQRREQQRWNQRGRDLYQQPHFDRTKPCLLG